MFSAQIRWLEWDGDVLVEEDDVGFPDFVGCDANDADGAELCRVPLQLVISPQLHTPAYVHGQRLVTLLNL